MKLKKVSVLAALLGLASGAPAVSAPGLKGLDGYSVEQVRAELGAPDVSQEAGSGALWTYRFETCALMVAFHMTEGRLRVFQILSGARHRGETPLSPQQCLSAGREQRAGDKVSDPIGDRLR